MSKYTTELRFICETLAGEKESVGYNDINRIVQLSAPKIFDFNFPIFDENYRLPLEYRFLKHFYTREICEETVGLWKLRVEDKLNLVMPYYNKLYESALLEFNPFYDVDVTTDHKTDFKSDSNLEENVGYSENSSVNNESTSNNLNWNLYSDTPQGGVNGLNSIDDNLYLTNARKETQSGGGTDDTESERTSETAKEATNKLKNLEEYLEHVKGKRGPTSYSNLLNEFRATFLRIDNMLMDELSTLFFGLW